jgi:hypothetical protein
MAAKKDPTPRIPNSKLDWVPAFLAALRDSGNVRAATQAAQVDRSTVYKLRDRDKGFAEAFVIARDEAADVLEAEALRRATLGVDEPVFYKGVPVGSVKRYSDALLIFLLKAARPQTYRENVSITTEAEPVLEQLTATLDEMAARRGNDG